MSALSGLPIVFYIVFGPCILLTVLSGIQQAKVDLLLKAEQTLKL